MGKAKKSKSESAATGSRLGAKGREQRAEVLRLAKLMILEHGISKLVIRQLASQANMELGNLQYYFSTRDDLLEALILDIFEQDVEAFVDLGAEVELSVAIRRLLGMWQGENGRIYHAVFAINQVSPRFRKLRAQVYSRFYNLLLPYLKKLKPRQSDERLLAKAKLMTAVMDGAGMQHHEGSRSEIKESIEGLHKDVLRIALAIAAE